MFRRVCLLICVVALSAPATTFAQSNPFGPVTPAPIPQPAAPLSNGEDTDVNEGEGDLETWQELSLYGAGGLIILFLGWLILRDAKRNAPVDDPKQSRQDAMAQGFGDKPKDPHAPRRKAVAREKGKAARKARKTTKKKHVGNVDVAGAHGPALGSEARALQPDEDERAAGLRLGRGVATPHERGLLEVQRGHERMPEPPDRLAVLAHVGLHGDAVVAADRLGDAEVVGDGVLAPRDRAALGVRDRAVELTGPRRGRGRPW